VPTLEEASVRLRVRENTLAHYVEEFSEFFPRGMALSEKDLARLAIVRDGKASEVTTDRDIRNRLAAISDAPAWDEMMVVPLDTSAFARSERPVTREDMVALVSSLAGVIMDLQDEVRSLRRLVVQTRERPALPPRKPWFHRLWNRLVAATTIRLREEEQLA
jgi:hypothetical protein